MDYLKQNRFISFLKKIKEWDFYKISESIILGGFITYCKKINFHNFH